MRSLRTTMYIAAIFAAWAWVMNEDYKVALAMQAERVAVQKPVCAERDYIGRQLVASYHARSDTMQTKRCTYKRVST